MHLAAQHNFFPIISYLIKHGVRVNATDQENETPLLVATKQGNNNIVTYLIENGADVNFAKDLDI